jgi:hypothetical protein
VLLRVAFQILHHVGGRRDVYVAQHAELQVRPACADGRRV